MTESTEAESAKVDQPTFSVFFHDEHPRLVAVAHALTGDRGQAEDIAQEALLRAYRRWDVVGGYDKPGAWVRRVVLNLATSGRRRRRSEHRAVLRLAAAPPASTSDPVDSVVAADVWAVVRALPRQQRAAITLHYLADESVADIAVALGCAEGTAKAHLHQARRSLARTLGEPDPEETS